MHVVPWGAVHCVVGDLGIAHRSTWTSLPRQARNVLLWLPQQQMPPCYVGKQPSHLKGPVDVSSLSAPGFNRHSQPRVRLFALSQVLVQPGIRVIAEFAKVLVERHAPAS